MVGREADLGRLRSLFSASPVPTIALVAGVTAFIGLVRFVALRWIFRPTVPRTA